MNAPINPHGKPDKMIGGLKKGNNCHFKSNRSIAYAPVLHFYPLPYGLLWAKRIKRL